MVRLKRQKIPSMAKIRNKNSHSAGGEGTVSFLWKTAGQHLLRQNTRVPRAPATALSRVPNGCANVYSPEDRYKNALTSTRYKS